MYNVQFSASTQGFSPSLVRLPSQQIAFSFLFLLPAHLDAKQPPGTQKVSIFLLWKKVVTGVSSSKAKTKPHHSFLQVCPANMHFCDWGWKQFRKVATFSAQTPQISLLLPGWIHSLKIYLPQCCLQPRTRTPSHWDHQTHATGKRKRNSFRNDTSPSTFGFLK